MDTQTPPTHPAPSAPPRVDGPSSRAPGDAADPAPAPPAGRRPAPPPAYRGPEPPKIDWL